MFLIDYNGTLFFMINITSLQNQLYNIKVINGKFHIIYFYCTFNLDTKESQYL